MANILTEEQRNISNWTKNMTSFPIFNNSYINGTNTLAYKGGSGYERIYLPVSVKTYTDYEFSFEFCSPTGFTAMYGSNYEYAGVQLELTESFLEGTLLTQPLNSNANTTLEHYNVKFNSQGYTTIYLVFDFGYMQDNVNLELIYSNISLNTIIKKYLISDGDKLYTVVDGTLSEITGTLNAQLFNDNGVDEIPSGTLLMTLSNPKVLCWTDSDKVPTLTATVKGIPEPQIVMSKEIDLMHSSIKGINGVTVDCKGDVLFAVSFDKKATWMMHNGTEFVVVSNELTGMTKEEFEAITVEQWQPKYEASSDMYIRCTILNETQSITKVNIGFVN